jgi:hypothetical protein
MKRAHTQDRSWQTNDRGPPTPERPILTVERLGPRRELMKNGNLVCYDVPVSRVGTMLYGVGEVPVQPDPGSHRIYVQRTADELFDPETVASFYGAAVTIGHPPGHLYPEGVTPDNFKELAVGYAVNPRPGRDGDEDVLLADLIITRRDAIKAITQDRKNEVSAGYDATYETVRPGVGRQSRIIANHIALVDKGRCGPRCAIGDHDPNQQQEHDMPAANQGGDRRRIRVDDVDYEEVPSRRRVSVADEDDERDTHIHVHVPALTNDAAPKAKDKDEDDDRIAKLETTVDSLAGTVTTLSESMRSFMSSGRKTNDEETLTDEEKEAERKRLEAEARAKQGKTEDSAALAASWQELASKAEILVPGFQMPTFDAAAQRQLTVDAMCGARKKALAEFAKDDANKALVTAIVGDASVADMDCAAAAVLFNAAAAAKATANNTKATLDAAHVPQVHSLGGKMPVSIQALNSANRKFWQQQTAHA